MRNLRTYLPIIVVGLLVLPTLSLQAQTHLDALTAAKKQRLDNLTVATSLLTRAIDDLVAEAAANGDLNAVKALVDQKRSFSDEGKLPYSNELSEAVKTYVESRKKLASQLYQEYQRTIKAHVDLNLSSEAASLEREQAAFVASEKQRLARVGEANEPKRVKSTAQGIIEYVKFYDDYCDKIISQETTARSQQLARDFPTQGNLLLKGQIWTLNFPIVEISELDLGFYRILVESPEEVAMAAKSFRCRTEFGMKLSKDVALAVKPGDILIATGTPICSLEPAFDRIVLKPTRIARKDNSDSFLDGNGIEFGNVKLTIVPAPKPPLKGDAKPNPKETKRQENVREFDSPFGKLEIQGVPPGAIPVFESSPKR